MNSIVVVDIAGVICFGGFILFFVSWWRRMRVAWHKPRPAKPQPIESAGELWGFAIAFLGLAVVIGNQLVDQMQRGAALRMTLFSLVACAGMVFVSGFSLGRLSMRWKRRMGGSATPHGEAWES